MNLCKRKPLVSHAEAFWSSVGLDYLTNQQASKLVHEGTNEFIQWLVTAGNEVDTDDPDSLAIVFLCYLPIWVTKVKADKDIAANCIKFSCKWTMPDGLEMGYMKAIYMEYIGKGPSN
jgi:hypothetical protein